MGSGPIGKIAVYLIADNEHIIFLTQLAYRLQFLFCPDTPYRIVRTAKDKQLDLAVLDFLLHIDQIHPVSAVLQHQRAVDAFPVVGQNGIAKRIIHRLLDQDPFSRLCKRPDGCCDGEYHARRLDEPFLLRLPLKMCAVPLLHCCKVVVPAVAVAVDTEPAELFQSLADRLRHAEVHIRYPERQCIFRHAAFRCEIVFDRVGIPPVDHLIKIIFHL